jgi:hypothetical protein
MVIGFPLLTLAYQMNLRQNQWISNCAAAGNIMPPAAHCFTFSLKFRSRVHLSLTMFLRWPAG